MRPARRRLAIALSSIALTLLLTLSPARAQLPEPELLVSGPYHLSLYEAEAGGRATVLMLHGGGWRGDLGPAADELMSEWIERVRGWGYDVANLGYRSGADSLRDALAAFDLLRGRAGPDAPICTFGGSAGGHLALIVAARRGAGVDCVVDLLGPPDLVDFGSRPASEAGEELARDAFGEDRVAALSPINNVERISSPVLVVAAPCDVFIELEDQREFVEALNGAGGDARLQVVATGDEVSLGHCDVTADSFSEATATMHRFLDEVSPAEAAVSAADDDDSPLVWLLAGAVIVAVAAGLVWTLRRRR